MDSAYCSAGRGIDRLFTGPLDDAAWAQFEETVSAYTNRTTELAIYLRVYSDTWVPPGTIARLASLMIGYAGKVEIIVALLDAPVTLDAAAEKTLRIIAGDLGRLFSWASVATFDLCYRDMYSGTRTRALTPVTIATGADGETVPLGAGTPKLELRARASMAPLLLDLLLARPEKLRELVWLCYDNDDVLLEIPASLTGLDSLTVPARLLGRVRGVLQPLKYLEATRACFLGPSDTCSVEACCLGPETRLVVPQPTALPQMRERIASITYINAQRVPAILRWRARLLHLDNTLATDIHCDCEAVVQRCDDYFKAVEDCPDLKVARVLRRNSWRLTPGNPLLDHLQATYPQALVLQVANEDGRVWTAFRNNRLPSALHDLLALASAVGLVTYDVLDPDSIEAKARAALSAVSLTPISTVPGVAEALIRQVILDAAGEVVLLKQPEAGHQHAVFGVLG